jgi:hypothetical protein
MNRNPPNLPDNLTGARTLFHLPDFRQFSGLPE